ncbi:unnamed protein product [Phytophthora fragariaefolia]|uniref:Unnamed protein product n=1 Tax=Phytophthora fragariaefolia TaxID=1490495 RepID=A0A9W6TMF4_9STRA|nr:unnamed protein product [Phytophthora fragariaefolia]
MHPVRMLSTKAKDARKLMIGIEYGWRPRRVWFRASSSAVYEQWNDVIRAALENCRSGECDEEESLAKWVERSEISTMETAATSGVYSADRCSSDSYARDCSSSYRSDIPDDEWRESEATRRELYQQRGSSADDTDVPVERSHRIESLAARYRSCSRERTDTVVWMGRPAFSFTGPDNVHYDGQEA